MTLPAIRTRAPRGVVAFEPFGWSFGFRTDSGAALRRISGLYRDFGIPVPGATSPMFVLERDGVGRSWRLTLDSETILQDATLAATLDALEYEVSKRILAARPDLMLIHGATVTGGERSALICGDSGAGKTTLALALAARGHAVLSDDAALLDPGTQDVFAVPRFLHLDSRSRRLLRSAGVPALQRTRARLLTTADLGGGVRRLRYPQLVLVLEPGGRNDEPRLTSMTQAEMSVRILRHVAWGEFPAADALRAITRLLSSASCYLLVRGRLDETAELVGEMLGARNAAP